MIQKPVSRIMSNRVVVAGIMLLLLLSTVPGWAQTGPDTMNFQGRLLDSDGNPVTEPRCMRFRLCNDADCAESPWPYPDAEFELHQVTPENGTYKAGLFTVALGSEHGIDPALLHDYDILFLEIGVAPWIEDCSDWPPEAEEWDTMEPRSQLRASAYALRSRRVRTTESDSGYLVEVNNTGSGGAVHAQTSSTTGGVAAGEFQAVGATGQTYGLSASSASGIGVRGIGGGPSGEVPSAKVGVWGDTSDGIGVLGYTKGTAANTTGVAGWAAASSGQTYGVWGSTSSDSGYGVYGTGTEIGMRGVGGNQSAYPPSGAVGVWGDSQAGPGVYGSSNSGDGVYGVAGGSGTTYGVYGRNAGASGAGVYGTSDDVSGLGVHGVSTNGDGVRGSSGDGTGVHGISTNGHGVYGYSQNSYGVYSAGNAHVEGELTWQAKTSYISVSPAAFNPIHGKQGIQFGSFFRALDGASIAVHGAAQIQLPHGATITKLSFFWEDTSDVDTGELKLISLNLDGTEDTMAIVSTNDTNPGVPSSSSTTTIAYPVIDNANYAYVLYLSMSDQSDASKNIYVYGAILEYTFTEPY